MNASTIKVVVAEPEQKIFITRCCVCKRYKDSRGLWVKLIAIPCNALFTDGICVPCMKAQFPSELVERVLARLTARGLL